MDYKCDGVKLLTVEELEKMHTKQLMKLRYNMPNPYCKYTCEGCDSEGYCKSNREQNRKLLKDILATRPHILNKKESYDKRKFLKKQGN